LKCLGQGDFETSHSKVTRKGTLVRALGKSQWDVVLADCASREIGVLEALEIVRVKQPDLPFIVVSSDTHNEVAAEAMRRGAHDSVLLGNLSRLVPAIEREVRLADDTRRRKQAREVTGRYKEYLEGLVQSRTIELKHANERLMLEIESHKNTEEALRQSQRRFRDLADNSPHIVLRFDEAMRHLYVNRAIVGATGRSPEAFLGKTNRELGMPEYLCKLWDSTVGQIFETRKPADIDFDLPGPGGLRSYRGEFVPEFGEDGNVKTVMGIVQDVTDQRRSSAALEALVRQRTDELIGAHRELTNAKRLSDIGNLAATVAHELRNPLGVMQIAIYNLKRKVPDPAAQKHIQNIEKKIQESSQIINSLMNYARLTPPAVRTTRLARIIDECLAFTAAKFGRSDVRVKRDTGPIESIELEIDPAQIKDVIVNILSNAYQAIPGRGTISLQAAVDDVEHRAVLTISDTGHGMAKDNLARAFDPFFTTKTHGTGLGLTISKDVVTYHRGEIEIHSQEGSGTRVTVALPLR
jgi:PAS domain S-box-containing protein